jgi:hypothetical protein
MDATVAGDASKLRAALQTEAGLSTLGNDPLLQQKALATMAEYLDAGKRERQRGSGGVWDMTVGELMRRTLQTAVDILNEMASLVSDSATLSGAALRRRAFAAFTMPERRLFVGVWLVALSFVLYFIDSTA